VETPVAETKDPEKESPTCEPEAKDDDSTDVLLLKCGATQRRQKLTVSGTMNLHAETLLPEPYTYPTKTKIQRYNLSQNKC